MAFTNNWKTIWSEKYLEINSKDLMGSLIKANGFDTGCGDYSTDQWKLMNVKLTELLKITNTSYVLEVGCGSGALLYGIKNHCQAKVFGYDFSSSLIKIANNFVQGEFKISEASQNPFDKIKFDFVISHSVFQYFPDWEYAMQTIRSMTKALKPGGMIALLDLNDAKFELIYHDIRRKNYRSPVEYDSQYLCHPHLFFNKREIFRALIQLGFSKITFPKHFVSDYVNSKYRFNIVGTKN